MDSNFLKGPNYMKKLFLVVLLVGIAGIAGIVRSHSNPLRGISRLPHVINGQTTSGADVTEEIRKNYELSADAKVEVSGINGPVTVETADIKTADVLVVRTGATQEVLNRRKVTVEATATSLRIHGDKSDTSLIGRIFGSSPSERVTLRLPRAVSLVARGINGPVVVGEITGAVEAHGINGRVQIAQASGTAQFNGVNGNIVVGLRQLGSQGIELNGINGNIELKFDSAVNASLKAHGMNGTVSSDLPNVVVDKASRGNYTAQIGNGGSKISANGINGNIRLTRIGTDTTGKES